MPDMRTDMIARPPDLQGKSSASSARGYADPSRPPQRQLRSARRTDDSADSAENNALALLGSPSSETPSIRPNEAGRQGIVASAVAALIKIAQFLNRMLPGSVTPEAAAWIEGLMQNYRQMLAQASSTTPSAAMTAGSPPQPQMPEQAGPPAMAMARPPMPQMRTGEGGPPQL